MNINDLAVRLKYLPLDANFVNLIQDDTVDALLKEYFPISRIHRLARNESPRDILTERLARATSSHSEAFIDNVLELVVVYEYN